MRFDAISLEPRQDVAFGEKLVLEMLAVSGSHERKRYEAEIKKLVRTGHYEEAIQAAHASTVRASVGLKLIAVELAQAGDITKALSVVPLVLDPDCQAESLVGIAEACRRRSCSEEADSALTRALTAAKKIRGEGWRHWRAMRLADIGVARWRLGQKDLAQTMCHSAQELAETAHNEVWFQTVPITVAALCQIGDLVAASAAVDRMKSRGGYPGAVRDAVGTLAAGFVAEHRVDEALALLAGQTPGDRFASMRLAGRRLACPMQAPWVKEVLSLLPGLERIAVCVGFASALQHLGQFKEAAIFQQQAVVLSKQTAEVAALPENLAMPASVAGDFALNLARSGQFADTPSVIKLVKDSDRHRVLREIAILHVQVGDLQAFREAVSALSGDYGQAEALAGGAAALVAAAGQSMAIADKSSPEKRLEAIRNEPDATRAAEELLQESFQLACRVSEKDSRDRLFWWIATAATVASRDAVAGAALSSILDLETRKLAEHCVARLSLCRPWR
jgi:tetratricopeptide (TPR) repeat protein